VRDAVGPTVDLLIEGHNRFSVSTAIRIGRRLEPYRPTWFEEPVPHQKVSSIVEVARHLDVAIATGESYSSPHQFAELLAHDAVHILQPEIQNLGGLLNTKKVCAMADAHYAVLAPHNAQGPVSTAMCLQIAACTPNFFLQEMFDEFNVEWEEKLVDRPARVVDGFLEIPSRPGLGVDLQLDEVARHPYAPQNFLPLFRSGWETREGADD
jgi:galactonate dehydratase